MSAEDTLVLNVSWAEVEKQIDNLVLKKVCPIKIVLVSYGARLGIVVGSFGGSIYGFHSSIRLIDAICRFDPIRLLRVELFCIVFSTTCQLNNAARRNARSD